MTSPNVVGITVTAKDQTAAGLDSVDKRIKKIGETTRTIADTITADFFQGAANAAKSFVTSTVRAASDLGESVNAVNKTFGESAKQVQDWGQANSAAFGLSRRAFNEAIIPTGALLKNAGLSMDQVAQSTINLTKRAADMGSVFNVDVAQVLADINSGLRGEADPLEKYGVQLSAAAVEQQALADTGKKSAAALTDQEKTTARVNLIMKQTASTAGDFADTTDGLANSARVASAQIEDAKAKIGEGLLPVLAKAAQIGGDAASKFGELPAPVQKTALAVGLVAASFVYLAPKVLAAKVALGELREGLSNTDTRMGRLAKTAATVAIVLTAVQVASAALGHSEARGVDETTAALEKLKKEGAQTSEITKHLDYDLGTLGSGGAAKAGNAIAGIVESTTGLGGVFDESLQHARERIASIDAALAQMVASGNAEQAAEIFDMLAAKAKEQGISLDDLKAGLPQYADALAGAGKKAEDTANQTKKATQEFNALGESLSGVKTPLAAVDEAFSVLLGRDHAIIGFAEATDQLSESLSNNHKQLKLNTDGGRENRDAILGVVEANLALYDSNIRSGMSAEDAAAKYNENTAALEAQLRKAGFTKTEIDGLIGKYRELPGRVTTEIAMKGLEKALQDLEDTLRAINNIPPRKRVTVEVREIFVGGRGQSRGGEYRTGGIKGAATGGIQDGLVKVGEEGEELVRLPTGSMVYPHANANQMIAGRGGGGIVINVHGSVVTERQLIDVIESTVSRLGGSPTLLGLQAA